MATDSAAGEQASKPSGRVAVLVLGTVVLYAVFLLVPSLSIARGCAVGAGLVVVASALLHEPKAMHAALLFALMMGWTASGGPPAWPLYLFVPLIAYGFSVRMVRPLRRSATWWRRGRVDRMTAAMMAGAVIVSSSALVLWLKLLHPDVSNLRDQLPDVGVPALLAIGLLFSVGNALLEEFIWRGVLLESLDAGLGVSASSVVVQALSFGVAHIAGFPRGALGVAMAAFYGLMLGAIRRSSGGLFAPVVTHVFADATIFALVVRFVR